MPLYKKPKTNGDWTGRRRALEKTTFGNERIEREPPDNKIYSQTEEKRLLGSGKKKTTL